MKRPWGIYRFSTILTPVATCALLVFPVVSPVFANSAPPPALAAQDFSPWVDEDDLAIDPRLLTVDDLKNLPSQKHFPAPAKQNEFVSVTLSPIESEYSRRTGQNLTQFGYRLLTDKESVANFSPASQSPALPQGAPQDDFVLGTGDEIQIILRGQKQEKQTTKITSEGLLVLDSLPPIMAAGRTIGDVRDELRSEAAQIYNTEIFISLTRVNQIGVMVTGHVEHPGQKSLTAFNTLIDALAASGGIAKTGTLRQIKLVRGDNVTVIDLYGLMIFGTSGMDMTLRDGDRIVVGEIGPTIAVSGNALKPGIYEILPALQSLRQRGMTESQILSANDLLDMAGGIGPLPTARFLKISLSAEGEDRVESVENLSERIFQGGDILSIGRGGEKRRKSVELIGNTEAAGLHALDSAGTLAELIYDDTVPGPDTYPLIGAIERWNRAAMTRNLIAFSPYMVLRGQKNEPLEDGDIVHLFTRAQIESLQRLMRKPGKPSVTEASFSSTSAPGDPSQITLAPELQSFLTDHAVFVRGSVRKPGPWPVADDTPLESILAVAGGPGIEADTGNIEVTSSQPGKSAPGAPYPNRRTIDLTKAESSAIRLHAGDTVRVNQKFRRVEDNHVVLAGEVLNPGTYDFIPGDTLGTLLARAGGLTGTAYPEGTIFSRESERLREETRFRSQARDLELRLAALLEQSDDDKKPDPKEVGIVRDLIAQLNQAEGLGRITVEANPSRLAADSSLDILLEKGDRVYIPAKPFTVRVAGEVMSPAALQFRDQKAARTYIKEAGGYTYNADKGRSFVVYPNGSAAPLSLSDWASSSVSIPPGSTIVVPRDPKPFNFIDTAKDLSQILANLATTALFTAEISRTPGY
jgi:polysaccharide export outer membrane protein